MPHNYTEDQLVEQPATGLFAALCGSFLRLHNLLLPSLPSRQIPITTKEIYATA